MYQAMLVSCCEFLNEMCAILVAYTVQSVHIQSNNGYDTAFWFGLRFKIPNSSFLDRLKFLIKFLAVLSVS